MAGEEAQPFTPMMERLPVSHKWRGLVDLVAAGATLLDEAAGLLIQQRFVLAPNARIKSLVIQCWLARPEDRSKPIPGDGRMAGSGRQGQQVPVNR